MNSLRLLQTYLLLSGIALGYGFLILWQGVRPVVLWGGGVVGLGALASWVWQVRSKTIPSEISENLLNQDNWLAQLLALESRLPQPPSPTWTTAKQWVLEIRNFAENIAQRESFLAPDLLETMHTVLYLSAQVVEALLAIEQMQTPTYKQLAQERLQNSFNRLQETHDQLQQLQDQIALGTLDQADNNAAIPERLRLLIADNKTTLQFPSDSHF